MKKINYILMMLVATFVFAACSTDDTPRLTSTVAPVLSDLSVDTIAPNDVNPTYTFNWTAARFYMDDNEAPTGVGSFDSQGVNYDLQIDLLGGDFSSAVSVGQVVSKTVLGITQSDVQNALVSGFGIDPTATSVDVIFRIVAKYSGVDSLTLVSNTIQNVCKFILAPPTKMPKFYIRDNAGYGDMSLYVWPDAGLAGWPGVHYNSIAHFQGADYYQFDLPSGYVNVPGLNFIANDNKGGQQLDLMGNFTFYEDVYITINADASYTVDEKPNPLFFICDEAGWGAMALYAWNETGNMLGWPGVVSTTTMNLNGKDYYVFDMPSDYINRAGLNFIANNNAGMQLDILGNFTFSDNVYVTITADGSFVVSDQP